MCENMKRQENGKIRGEGEERGERERNDDERESERRSLKSESRSSTFHLLLVTAPTGVPVQLLLLHETMGETEEGEGGGIQPSSRWRRGSWASKGEDEEEGREVLRPRTREKEDRDSSSPRLKRPRP